jgi:hypothetical protein
MTIKIEYDFTNSVMPDYGMFTDAGNNAVQGIVIAARVHNLTWAQTLQALRKLAEHDEFGEAMDTAVRECVYNALGIADQPFYVRHSNG